MTKEDISNLTCSFCGKPRGAVRRIIAGPGAYICDECVIAHIKLHVDMADDETFTQGHCSFCKEEATYENRIIKGPSDNICRECVLLCVDVFTKPVEYEEGVEDRGKDG